MRIFFNLRRFAVLRDRLDRRFFARLRNRLVLRRFRGFVVANQFFDDLAVIFEITGKTERVRDSAVKGQLRPQRQPAFAIKERATAEKSLGERALDDGIVDDRHKGRRKGNRREFVVDALQAEPLDDAVRPNDFVPALQVKRVRNRPNVADRDRLRRERNQDVRVSLAPLVLGDELLFLGHNAARVNVEGLQNDADRLLGAEGRDLLRDDQVAFAVEVDRVLALFVLTQNHPVDLVLRRQFAVDAALAEIPAPKRRRRSFGRRFLSGVRDLFAHLVNDVPAERRVRLKFVLESIFRTFVDALGFVARREGRRDRRSVGGVFLARFFVDEIFVEPERFFGGPFLAENFGETVGRAPQKLRGVRVGAAFFFIPVVSLIFAVFYLFF